jgi:undecaprenyl diphosphate synthase
MFPPPALRDLARMKSDKLPAHVAVIMDGNGRWARQKGLRRLLGHRQGAEAVRTVVRTNRELGIPWLTLYAFSEENWKRPSTEVRALMGLLKQFVRSESGEMLKNGIRLRTIGRTDKIPEETRIALFEAMELTARNSQMTLTLALSYGGRQELTDAVRAIAVRIQRGEMAAADITEERFARFLYCSDMPDPDLLIRTSGEYRISNFLLWQIAYSELYFTPTLWPDFGREEYLAAIRAFQDRERRFGNTPRT